MIRLRLQNSLALEGEFHKAGDVLEVTDARLAESLLRSGVAVPVDPVTGSAWWREKAHTPSWVSSWRH